MAWENIEKKLQKPLTVKVSFPKGTIWLPENHLTIDSWLDSVAQTDEEILELNIPRIRFLQNRWPIDRLLELEWDDQFSNRRVIGAMYVGDRAYILFSDWNEYQVIAAIEPKDNAALYRAVIGKLLENRSFVPTRPNKIRNRRPDLVPDLDELSGFGEEEMRSESYAIPSAPRFRGPAERWKAFLSDIFVGWIGKWLNLPEAGFWHEDAPESISRTTKPAAWPKNPLPLGEGAKREPDRAKP